MHKRFIAAILAASFAAPIAAPGIARAAAVQEWTKTGMSLADLVGAGMTVFSVQSVQLDNGMQRIFWLRGVLAGRSTLAQCGEEFVAVKMGGATGYSMTDAGCGTLVAPHVVP